MAAVDAETGQTVFSAADLARMSQEKTRRLQRELGAEGPEI
jgi:hypothetical protein